MMTAIQTESNELCLQATVSVIYYERTVRKRPKKSIGFFAPSGIAFDPDDGVSLRVSMDGVTETQPANGEVGCLDDT